MLRSSLGSLMLLFASCTYNPLPDDGWDPAQPAEVWLSGEVAYFLSSEGAALVFRFGAYELIYPTLLLVGLLMFVMGFLMFFEQPEAGVLCCVGSAAFLLLLGPWVGDEEVRIEPEGITIDVSSWYDWRHHIQRIPASRIRHVEVRDRMTWWTQPYATVVLVHDEGEQVVVRFPQGMAISDARERRNLRHAQHIGAMVRERLALPPED